MLKNAEVFQAEFLQLIFLHYLNDSQVPNSGGAILCYVMFVENGVKV